MREHLQVFERDGNPDRACFERQTMNAVDKARKLSLLRRIRGSYERCEVSPTLKLLFAAEQIQALARTYAKLAASPAHAHEHGDGPAQQQPSDEAHEDGEEEAP